MNYHPTIRLLKEWSDESNMLYLDRYFIGDIWLKSEDIVLHVQYFTNQGNMHAYLLNSITGKRRTLHVGTVFKIVDGLTHGLIMNDVARTGRIEYGGSEPSILEQESIDIELSEEDLVPSQFFGWDDYVSPT